MYIVYINQDLVAVPQFEVAVDPSTTHWSADWVDRSLKVNTSVAILADQAYANIKHKLFEKKGDFYRKTKYSRNVK